MCVIIAKKAGVDALNEEYFNNAWDHNPDGGGIVWKEKGGQVMFQKGFMKKEDMLKVLQKVNQKDTSFIAHFRIKSVGDVKPENCHPFVMKNVTFAHNGTLSIKPVDGKTDSETFGLAILYSHTMKWIKDNQLLLEMALGSSKFAIMDNKTGEIFILNEDLGREKDDAWFSNDSAFPTPKTYYPQRWSSLDDDYSSYDYNKTAYMADRTLGTKNFTPGSYYNWDYEKSAWVDKDTKILKRPYNFKDGVVIGKNGLWTFVKDHKPGDDLTAKAYTGKSCPEYSYLVAAQTNLNRLLDEYRKTKFNTWGERDSYETELHAQALVLNACRRLVTHKKALTMDNMTDYIYQYLSDNTWNHMSTMKEFFTILSYYIEECDEIVKAKNKTILSKRDIKQAVITAHNA